MKAERIIRVLLCGMVILLCYVLMTEFVFAQCVMCKASLPSNSLFARNLNIGVLVLLAPPVSIFCTIFILAIWRRKSD